MCVALSLRFVDSRIILCHLAVPVLCLLVHRVQDCKLPGLDADCGVGGHWQSMHLHVLVLISQAGMLSGSASDAVRG